MRSDMKRRYQRILHECLNSHVTTEAELEACQASNSRLASSGYSASSQIQ